eukprot:Sdes_comp17137_c0_seq1m6305
MLNFVSFVSGSPGSSCSIMIYPSENYDPGSHLFRSSSKISTSHLILLPSSLLSFHSFFRSLNRVGSTSCKGDHPQKHPELARCCHRYQQCSHFFFFAKNSF